MRNTTTVEQISEFFIKPKHEVEELKCPHLLTPWDLPMLSLQYIQKGLMFTKPSDFDEHESSIKDLVEDLKDSLSLTLVHFYPLAGRLATEVDEDRHECLVFVDCNKGPGARFIHASLHLTMADILSPTDVPPVVISLFDHDRAVNHEGHTRPLLSVQVTELLDGVFIGVSISHAIVDGTSFWHFWNSWSEIHKAKRESVSLSRPPFLRRWFPDGYGPSIKLPFTDPNEFINRYESPPLRQRFFHFSSDSIAKLKAKANEENSSSSNNKISSLQALMALVWRSIVRSKNLAHDQVTCCRMPVNYRHRLHPPLPETYFGNAFGGINATARAGELLEHDLGWAASQLHKNVRNVSDDTVRHNLAEWLRSPSVRHVGLLSSSDVLMTGSPRFEVYGNEFGVGKAVAVRSGSGNKFSGHVAAYPGIEQGSVDLEICLKPDSMTALESDDEVLAAVNT